MVRLTRTEKWRIVMLCYFVGLIAFIVFVNLSAANAPEGPDQSPWPVHDGEPDA